MHHWTSGGDRESPGRAWFFAPPTMVHGGARSAEFGRSDPAGTWNFLTIAKPVRFAAVTGGYGRLHSRLPILRECGAGSPLEKRSRRSGLFRLTVGRAKRRKIWAGVRRSKAAADNLRKRSPICS